ncbi:hypothetical protein HanIR_Chr07g0332401 [Helianthus annuus]|nr:hypothetical protein HanIR_Chr07g0332401 [Helianthus annuus]
MRVHNSRYYKLYFVRIVVCEILKRLPRVVVCNLGCFSKMLATSGSFKKNKLFLTP